MKPACMCVMSNLYIYIYISVVKKVIVVWNKLHRTSIEIFVIIEYAKVYSI